MKILITENQLKNLVLNILNEDFKTRKQLITSLGNLEEVGEKIYIKDSELIKRYSIQQLEEMYPQFEGKFRLD